MPIKVKVIISILVFIITIFMFYNHLVFNEFLKSIIIILIGIIMIFGLWILPEATGKIKDKNEKK